MGYSTLLMIHMSCAILSISFFVVRGFWMLTENRLLQSKPVKILPHIIDTVLLAAGIWLTTLIEQYPFQSHWLTVKVVLLLTYIGLGMVALKRGKTKRIRAVAFVAAIATFAFLLTVARSHNPAGIFGTIL